MDPPAVQPMIRRNAAAEEDLSRRLQLSLILRVIMVTFLLAATFSIQFSKKPAFTDESLFPLYILSGLTYFVTFVSALLLRSRRRLRGFAFAQITWELLFVSALIYVTTGPEESIFSFLYLLAIIMAGILQYRAGAFYAAAGGTLLYAFVLIGLELNFLPQLPFLPYAPIGWPKLLYNLFINLAAMFGMAGLSSYLTEKLRRTGVQLEQTQRYRDILEALNDIVVRSIPSGLITVDLKGRITSFNPAAEKITHLPPSQILGRSFHSLFPQAPDSLPFRERGIRRLETFWKDPAGNSHHLEFILSPMHSLTGERLGTLVVINDITEIREMEKKLRQTDRLAAVGQLAAGIAHEIRNPLASISGSIQVLAADLTLDPANQRLMNIILRETSRLNTLITDFLLYARPVPGNLQSVRLDFLIQEMVELYKQRPDIPSGVKWHLDLQPGLSLTTDPKLFHQILWNLVHNAVLAMNNAGTITIRAAETLMRSGSAGPPERAAGNGQIPAVCLEVEDMGPGIPLELRDKIFDPFFTTRQGGTGLGLSTVYRIVEALEGTITVADSASGGARFIVTIPQRRASVPQAATEMNLPGEQIGG